MYMLVQQIYGFFCFTVLIQGSHKIPLLNKVYDKSKTENVKKPTRKWQYGLLIILN